MAAVEAIRNALTGYHRLVGTQAPMWPLAQLRAAVVEAHTTYQAAEYDKAGRLIPELLSVVDAYDDRSPDVQMVRTSAYIVAAKLLRKVGEIDLAWITADRAATAALASGSEAARAHATYQVIGALLRSQRTEEAERIAVTPGERVDVSSNTGGSRAGVADRLTVAAVKHHRRAQSRPARRNRTPHERRTPLGHARWRWELCVDRLRPHERRDSAHDRSSGDGRPL